MLNKKLTENDVRQIFEKYGAIEECTVLRDQNSQSKGCAFVTFASKQAAIAAIKVYCGVSIQFQYIYSNKNLIFLMIPTQPTVYHIMFKD